MTKTHSDTTGTSSLPRRAMVFSPWLFGAACGLLVVIIGVFAFNNVRREQSLMKRTLSQEGKAILNVVAAGARAELRRSLMRRDSEFGNWSESIQRVIASSAEHDQIRALFLVEETGTVIAHNDQLPSATDFSLQSLLPLLELNMAPGNIIAEGMDRDAKTGEQFYRIVSLFSPLPMGRELRPSPPNPYMRGSRMSGREDMAAGAERFRNYLADKRFLLVVELKADGLVEALRRQYFQIGILSLVLLLVGAGGILSLFTLSGWRGSQRQLSHMRSFTEELLNALPLGVLATDSGGLIRTCNKSARLLLRLPEEGFIGSIAADVLPPALMDFVEKAHRTPVMLEKNLVFDHEDIGSAFLHLTCFTVDTHPASPSTKVLMIQDLSRIRSLEDELRRLEHAASLGKVAAGVAHELRNPLSSIKGITLLLKERIADDENALQTVSLLISEIDRLNRSIDELLSYARPSTLSLQTIDVRDVLLQAVELVSNDAVAGGIEMVKSIPDTECSIEADKDKLLQVFLNVLLNAIQATGSGGTIRTSIQIVDERVCIEFSDSGCGIGAEKLPKVFDPYFSTKKEGTGLGLALSKKIIEDHNGRISITSEEKRGTIVTLAFRRPQSHEP
jgi:two-component system sensor histidine kinase HydH